MDPRCDDECQHVPFCTPERMTMLGPPSPGVVGDATTTDLVTVLPGPTIGPFKVVGRKTIPCIGSPCERVLIEGKVLARSFVLNPPGLPLRPENFEENAMSSCMNVKLRAKRCNYPGWVYFDSDSHVTLPGGDAIEVQAVAPAFWLATPSDNGPLPFEPPAQVTWCEVRVRACLCTHCARWPGRLTWWSVDEDSNQVHLRPPRATELQLITSSGQIPTSLQFAWRDIGGIAIPGIAFATSATDVTDVQVPGAAEQLLLSGTPAPVEILYVWRIE